MPVVRPAVTPQGSQALEIFTDKIPKTATASSNARQAIVYLQAQARRRTPSNVEERTSKLGAGQKTIKLGTLNLPNHWHNFNLTSSLGSLLPGLLHVSSNLYLYKRLMCVCWFVCCPYYRTRSTYTFGGRTHL